MKLTKKIISIFSIVISGFILLQSCASGVVNSIEDNGSSSGTGGLLLVVFMLVGAILNLSSDEHKTTAISGIFYIIGGFIGLFLSLSGSFADLTIWGFMCLIFGLIFIIGGVMKS